MTVELIFPSLDLLFYAEIIGDIEKLVQYYIQHGFWKRALDALDKQNEESLYYKHCPLLMEKIPQETVNLLIKKPNLSPRLVSSYLVRSRQVWEVSHRIKGWSANPVRIL